MIESIEKLRSAESFSELATSIIGDDNGFRSVQEFWCALADAIEAEIAERYIELPVDADGEIIHVGDTVYSDFHDEWRDGVTVYEIAFTDGDGTRVYTADGKWVKVNRCSHTKPRTIEDVLRDCCNEWNEHCGEEWETGVYAKYADELREMIGGE